MPPTMLPAGKAFFTKAASSRNSTVLHFILLILILPHVHFLLCLILLLLKYSSSCSSPCFFLLAFLLHLLFPVFLLFFSFLFFVCIIGLVFALPTSPFPACRAQKQQKQQKAEAAKEAAKTQMNSQLWKAKINFWERKSLSQHICAILTILIINTKSLWNKEFSKDINRIQEISLDFMAPPAPPSKNPQTPTVTGWVVCYQLPRLKSQTFKSHGAPRSLAKPKNGKTAQLLRMLRMFLFVFCVFIIVIGSHRVRRQSTQVWKMQLGQKHKFQLHCHYIS